MSPYFLVHGQEPQLAGAMTELELTDIEFTNAEWPKRIQRLEELRHKIKLNMRKETERQEKYHGISHEIPEIIKRRRVEFYVRGTHPDEDVVAGINVGREAANTTSVAVQCSLQAEDRVEQNSTARESTLTRLGPAPTPGPPPRTTETPSVVNPVGVVAQERPYQAAIDTFPSMEVASAGFARPSSFGRVGDISRKTGQKCLSKGSKWHGLTPNQSRMVRRRLSLNKALENPETKESILWQLWFKAATREERDLYGRLTHLGPMVFGANPRCQEVGSETLPKSSEMSTQVSTSQPTVSPPAAPVKASSPLKPALAGCSAPKDCAKEVNQEASKEASKGAIPRTRLASVVVSVQKESQIRSVVFKKPRDTTSTVTSGSWAASTTGAVAPRSTTSEARPVALRLGPPPVPAFPSGSASGGFASYLVGSGPMLPAFAEYRASLATAVGTSTSRGGQGIPRVDRSEPRFFENAPPVKRSKKKKKKKKKDGVRGMDWANAEFVGSGEPISEDSGMELDPYDDRDKTDEDDDVLEINYIEDL
ncbi:hypothetical protein KQX54_015314 [Cotesia glomerata]|uniref:Uncharacterized protein n=1 Tax=Cotesia glomerata TaxID=32391 RepID=A0AAV7J4N6_COTGL|nr:hypothetical protein KQX54_015314 [Cotesia glomerata]